MAGRGSLRCAGKSATYPRSATIQLPARLSFFHCRAPRRANASGDAEQAPRFACPSAGSTGTAKRVKQDLGGHDPTDPNTPQLCRPPVPPTGTTSGAIAPVRFPALLHPLQMTVNPHPPSLAPAPPSVLRPRLPIVLSHSGSCARICFSIENASSILPIVLLCGIGCALPSWSWFISPDHPLSPLTHTLAHHPAPYAIDRLSYIS